MKRTTLSICLMFAASGILMFSSCTKTDVTFDFPITITTNSFGPYAAHTSHEVSTDVISKLDSIVSANGGSLDRLKKVEIKSVTVTSADQPNFAGFSNAEVNIQDGSGGTNLKLAFKTSVPQTEKTVTFDKSSYDDLASYLKASSFKVTLTDYNDGAVLTNRATVNAIFTVTLSGK
jgi:hypothetical protein